MFTLAMSPHSCLHSIRLFLMMCSHTLCLLPLKIPLSNSLRTKNSIVDKNPKFCPLKQLDSEIEHGIRIDRNKERSDSKLNQRKRNEGEKNVEFQSPNVINFQNVILILLVVIWFMFLIQAMELECNKKIAKFNEISEIPKKKFNVHCSKTCTV